MDRGQLTIKVIMPYMHVIDSLIRETRCYSDVIFLHIKD